MTNETPGSAWRPCINCSVNSTGKMTHCYGCPNDPSVFRPAAAPGGSAGTSEPATTLLAALEGEHGSGLLARLAGAQRCLDARVSVSSWVAAKIDNEAADWIRQAADLLRAGTPPAAAPEPAAWLGFNHELKCWPGPFEAMLSGAKTAEFRRDDRGFKVGDILRLREWTPQRAEYAGRELYRRVTHILGPEFGVPDGFVMLSLAAPPAAVREPAAKRTEGPCIVGGSCLLLKE